MCAFCGTALLLFKPADLEWKGWLGLDVNTQKEKSSRLLSGMKTTERLAEFLPRTSTGHRSLTYYSKTFLKYTIVFSYSYLS